MFIFNNDYVNISQGHIQCCTKKRFWKENIAKREPWWLIKYLTILSNVRIKKVAKKFRLLFFMKNCNRMLRICHGGFLKLIWIVFFFR